MARILQCGWETGDVAQIGAFDLANPGTAAVPSAVTTVPTPRSGSYCLKCPIDGTTTGNRRNAVQIAHASKSELYYAFGLYSHASTYTGVSPGNAFLILKDTVGNVNLLVTLDAGVIHASVATSGGTGINPTLTTFGAASGSCTYDVWHLVEIHVIASTTTTGTFELKLDGVSVISVTSQRTCQTNANFGSLTLGGCSSLGNTVASLYNAFDDLRANDTTGSVNNSWPGDEKILLMKPTSAGDSAQFTRAGVDSGANWSQMNDLPPNGTTSSVTDSTVGHLDLYNTDTVTVVSVSAISVIGQLYNGDGAGGSVDLVTKTAAGESDGSAFNVTGTPTYYTRLLEADPADTGAWSQTKIDALQVGIKLAS